MESAGDGTICSVSDPNVSSLSRRSDDPPIHYLTRGDSIGLAFNVEAGFISLLAVLIVFSLIARNVVRHVQHLPARKRHFIQQPLDLYMLSLFVGDLLQAIATLIDIKWVHEGKAEKGAACTAEGVLTQLGNVGVAMSTLAIAIQTFVAIWWGRGRHSLTLAAAAVTAIWLYNLVFAGIAIGRNYETPSPYWCWVDSEHLFERLAGQYIWCWIALAASVLTYVPLYFWVNGNVIVNPDKWFDFSVHRSKRGSDQDAAKLIRRYRLIMLAYPLVYIMIIIPLSVVRFISFSDAQIPSAPTFIVKFIYQLSGFLDVLLFLFTRPNLLLFTPRSDTSSGGAPSQTDKPWPGGLVSPSLAMGSFGANDRGAVDAAHTRHASIRTIIIDRLPDTEVGQDDAGAHPLHGSSAGEQVQDDHQSRNHTSENISSTRATCSTETEGGRV